MAAVQPDRQQHSTSICAAAAATMAAIMLAGIPVYAADTLTSAASSVKGFVKDPVGKVLNKLDSYDPPKGVPGPEVPGQFRADPDKARQLALENSPAGSPEAERAASAANPGR
eukprot:gene13018-13147_t